MPAFMDSDGSQILRSRTWWSVSVLSSHPRHTLAILKRWGHGSEQGACTANDSGEAADC
jgi:hypothetical protein